MNFKEDAKSLEFSNRNVTGDSGKSSVSQVEGWESQITAMRYGGEEPDRVHLSNSAWKNSCEN